MTCLCLKLFVREKFLFRLLVMIRFQWQDIYHESELLHLLIWQSTPKMTCLHSEVREIHHKSLPFLFPIWQSTPSPVLFSGKNYQQRVTAKYALLRLVYISTCARLHWSFSRKKIFFDTWINTACHYFLKLVFNYLKFRNVIMWWQMLHWVSHSQVSKTARITLCFTVKSIIRARLSHNPTSVYVWSRWSDRYVG